MKKTNWFSKRSLSLLKKNERGLYDKLSEALYDNEMSERYVVNICNDLRNRGEYQLEEDFIFYCENGRSPY